MSDVIIMGSQGPVPAHQRGRLIFALDATASRGPTWNIARDLQAKMFREAAPLGELELQLVYYGGTTCQASRWHKSGERLVQLMNGIKCEGGCTQIGRVLEHVLHEHEKAPIKAVTFIGDAIEVDDGPWAGIATDRIDVLSDLAGQLGAKGVPLYMFQEGHDDKVAGVFRIMALRSGGKYFQFNPEKPRAIERLSAQLNAVARLAVGDTGAVKRIAAK